MALREELADLTLHLGQQSAVALASPEARVVGPMMCLLGEILNDISLAEFVCMVMCCSISGHACLVCLTSVFIYTYRKNISIVCLIAAYPE